MLGKIYRLYIGLYDVLGSMIHFIEPVRSVHVNESVQKTLLIDVALGSLIRFN